MTSLKASLQMKNKPWLAFCTRLPIFPMQRDNGASRTASQNRKSHEKATKSKIEPLLGGVVQLDHQSIIHANGHPLLVLPASRLKGVTA